MTRGKEFPATERTNKDPLPLAKLYWCHIGILLLGILLGTLIAYLFVSLDLHFPGELQAARKLGIVSLTILAGYPKSRDILAFVSILGFPIIFSMAIWLFWRGKQRSRDLTEAFRSAEESTPLKNSGRIVCLLVVIGCYLFFSFDMNYFYWITFGWGLLGEEGGHLAIVQSILSGGVYGRDFASPYGPMMTYPMVWSMKLFGTTILAARVYTYLLNLIAYGLVIFFLYRTLKSKASFLLSSMIYLVAFPVFTLPAPQWSYLRVTLGFFPLLLAYLYLQDDKKYLLPIGGAILGQSLLFSQEVGICSLFSLFALLMMNSLATRNWKMFIREVSLVLTGCFASLIPMLLYFYFKGALPAFFMNIYEYPKYFAIGFGALPFPNFKDFLASPWEEGAWFAYWIIFLYIVSASYLIPRILLGQLYKDHFLKVSLLIFGILLFRSALGRSDLHHFHFVSPPAFLLVFLFADGSIRGILKPNPIWSRTAKALSLVMLLTSTLFLFMKPVAFTNNRYDWRLLENGYRIPDLKRGGVLFDLRMAETLKKIHNFLETNTAPGEYTYFFPNEAAYYFLFNRNNPTRYFGAYHAVTKKQRRELVGDLEKNKPKYIIYSGDAYRIDGIREDRQVPEVLEYLYKEYRLDVDLKQVLILKRIGS